MFERLFKRVLCIVAVHCITIPVSGQETVRLKAFGAELEAHQKLLHLPGLTVAVMEEGDVVFRKDIGYSDLKSETPIGPDAIFPIASITKTFSAAILMQYVREHRIDLDDPITSYPFVSVGFFPQRVTPDIRLKHILSHTSEGHPGSTFIYHGGRFNFVAGVFRHVLGKGPDSFMEAIQKRIIQALGLKNTLTRHPGSVEPSRMVTSYTFDKGSRRFAAQQRGQSVSYPATGLLSTADDLLKYSHALDEHTLMDEQSYTEMTRPQSGDSKVSMPYGLGWFNQKAHGVTMHWAYGLGDSDSAMLLRIPELKLTLVVLSNCSFASEPYRFGAGNALNSPFVIAFLKHFVVPEQKGHTSINYDRSDQIESLIPRDAPIYVDELGAQVFSRTFMQQRFDRELGSEKLLEGWIKLDAARFSSPDPSLMYLLSHHPANKFDGVTHQLLNACRKNFSFHPEVEFEFAKRLERKGFKDEALAAYRKVADFQGFEEQISTIEACTAAARLLREKGTMERARDYEWRSQVYAFQAGYRIDPDLAP